MKTSEKMSVAFIVFAVFSTLILTVINEVQMNGCLVKESKKAIGFRNYSFLEAKEIQQETIRNISRCQGLYHDEN